MTEDNKQPVSDISKMLNTAMSGITGMVSDVKSQLSEKIESYLAKMDLVKREEFELIKTMLTESRLEQNALKHKLDSLEKLLTPKK